MGALKGSEEDDSLLKTSYIVENKTCLMFINARLPSGVAGEKLAYIAWLYRSTPFVYDSPHTYLSLMSKGLFGMVTFEWETYSNYGFEIVI